MNTVLDDLVEPNSCDNGKNEPLHFDIFYFASHGSGISSITKRESEKAINLLSLLSKSALSFETPLPTTCANIIFLNCCESANEVKPQQVRNKAVALISRAVPNHYEEVLFAATKEKAKSVFEEIFRPASKITLLDFQHYSTNSLEHNYPTLLLRLPIVYRPVFYFDYLIGNAIRSFQDPQEQLEELLTETLKYLQVLIAHLSKLLLLSLRAFGHSFCLLTKGVEGAIPFMTWPRPPSEPEKSIASIRMVLDPVGRPGNVQSTDLEFCYV